VKIERATGRFAAVRFVPIAVTGGDRLRAVVARLSAWLALPCRLVDDAGRFRDLPTVPGRSQVDADGLLRLVEERAEPDGPVLVGLTDRDMGNGIFTFFFGRARHLGHAAVVSLARLTPTYYGLPDDPDLTIRRAALEVLHELGHVAGLEHCRDHGCIMHFASSVESLDNRGVTFCRLCLEALPVPLLRDTGGRRGGST